MSNKVIRVENLSKQYRLGVIGATTIRDDLKRIWAKAQGKENPALKIGDTNTLAPGYGFRTSASDYVWALRDINFDIEQGESVGIIGKNGAGKSTLLKILSKVTAPTLGQVKIKGRIASLLEVGTGFHPELTGKENIFLNGAILGMTKAEIRSKYDEIVDFSGVERYIDTAVKRYSSGMYVRLAFAVAAHLEPEILVVDEVLAVGDAEFQKKCIGKIGEVNKEGRTVLFVSHNMPSVLALCSKGILLSEGKIISEGKIDEVVKEYHHFYRAENVSRDISTIKNREGNGKIRFVNYKILNSLGEEIEKVYSGQDIIIQADFNVNSSEVLPPLHFSVKFVNDNDVPLFHVSNSVTNGKEFKFNSTIDKGSVTCKIPKFPLQPGEYFFHLFCSDLSTVYDNINFAGTINVDAGNFFSTGKLPAKNLGDFLVTNEWSIEF